MGIVQEIGKFVNEEEKGFIRTKKGRDNLPLPSE